LLVQMAERQAEEELRSLAAELDDVTEEDFDGASAGWSDDSFSGVWAGNAAADAGVDDAGSSWNSDLAETSEGGQQEWISRVAAPKRKALKRIETTAVGMVDVHFARRNGFHAEVTVQHKKPKAATVHRLWVSSNVMQEIAALRGKKEHEIEIERVCEEIVEYLDENGVDLADPDWAMEDDSVPFSSDFFAARTLLNYYADLKQHLAEKLLGPAKSE